MLVSHVLVEHPDLVDDKLFDVPLASGQTNQPLPGPLQIVPDLGKVRVHRVETFGNGRIDVVQPGIQVVEPCVHLIEPCVHLLPDLLHLLAQFSDFLQNEFFWRRTAAKDVQNAHDSTDEVSREGQPGDIHVYSTREPLRRLRRLVRLQPVPYSERGVADGLGLTSQVLIKESDERRREAQGRAGIGCIDRVDPLSFRSSSSCLPPAPTALASRTPTIARRQPACRRWFPLPACTTPRRVSYSRSNCS